jgi:hypothetical protein
LIKRKKTRKRRMKIRRNNGNNTLKTNRRKNKSKKNRRINKMIKNRSTIKVFKITRARIRRSMPMNNMRN